MSNENSRLDYESGVTPFAMEILTDSGDRKKFTSNAALFSETTGNAPDIKPNGVLTGGLGVPAVSLTNNAVDVAALTCNLNGVETSVSASLDEAITRAATDVASITSVTVDQAGAVVVVIGTDSADATFSETRAAAGGPPLIPVDSIELFQVRTTTNVAAPIVAAEIFQVIGTHFEKADFPGFTADNFNAEVNFDATLPAIHTGVIAKAVHASYADPIFTEQAFANDFIPADNANSVSSEQVYGATVASASSSLGQGSFTAILKNGITDGIVGRKGENLFFRYLQDKFKTANILTQGKFGIARTFNAADNPKVACTITATEQSVERVS